MTREHYVAVFVEWFGVLRASGDLRCARIAATVERPFLAAVAEGGLPDEGEVNAFCAVLIRRLPYDVCLPIQKSSFLDRRLYGGETLRTERCPIHQGRWSGVAGVGDDCPHGCGLTGWLPARVPA